MRGWIAAVLLAVVCAACGRVEGPPTCTGVYQGVFAWKSRCDVAVPANAPERARMFCDALASAPGVKWSAQEACVRALETAECGRFPHECVLLGAGNLPGGAVCTNLDVELAIHSQCQSGTCDAPAGEGCGTCTAARLEGSACGEGSACASGFTCRIDFGKTIGTCAVANGKAGDACSTSTDCSSETYCDYNSRLCEPRRSKGASCWSGYECAKELVCGGMPGTCVEPAGVGEYCTARDCASGLVCSSGVCANRASSTEPAIPDGSPCTDPLATCEAFARCIHGVCRLPSACP